MYERRLATIFAICYYRLWCQQGGLKLYSPKQCPAQTLECFKYTCDAEQADIVRELHGGRDDRPMTIEKNFEVFVTYQNAEFVARGCGVSLLTRAAGLPNESCYQAISVCEKVGGKGTCFTCNDQHMCNPAPELPLLIVALLIVIVRI